MMVSDPERFIQEKLQKRFLSINTVRDAILASMIFTLQRVEELQRGEKLDEEWRNGIAAELRKKMVQVCEAEKIPTEYPSLEQLNLFREKLEELLGFGQLDPGIRESHNQNCNQLLAKAEE